MTGAMQNYVLCCQESNSSDLKIKLKHLMSLVGNGKCFNYEKTTLSYKTNKSFVKDFV